MIQKIRQKFIVAKFCHLQANIFASFLQIYNKKSDPLLGIHDSVTVLLSNAYSYSYSMFVWMINESQLKKIRNFYNLANKRRFEMQAFK